MNRRDTRILGFAILALLALSLLLLAGCASEERPIRRAVAAPAVSTAALTGNISQAQMANLSAKQKAARMRELLAEDDKLIKTIR